MPLVRLRISPIVEGHGEVGALPRLLRRVGKELLNGVAIDVLQPHRRPRNRLIGDIGGELRKAVEASARSLAERCRDGVPPLILTLIDADDGCAASMASEMNRIMRATRSDIPSTCVVAVKEYETWFVAAAESLGEFIDLGGVRSPIDPESQRCGKAWIEQRIRRKKYSETIDQREMTEKMDLHLCRAKCPSFDKLCRELEKAIAQGGASPQAPEPA